MDVVGIDISKAKFDAALLVGTRSKHATFSNTEAGFKQVLAWLAKHRSDPAVSLHACLTLALRAFPPGDRLRRWKRPATGVWSLLMPCTATASSAFRAAKSPEVSVVNPARIKAFGESELARNKTDKLDAALIARFCRAHVPSAWTPPLAHLRELRELVRRCDALKAARVQELNRQQAGFASPAVARSIAAHLEWLDQQIAAVTAEARGLVTADPITQ